MNDEEKIEGEKLQGRSFLEHLCYKYFKEDAEKMYNALSWFVPDKLPVNPKNPDKPLDYDYILHDYMHDYFKTDMPQVLNYERAALVALLNGDYEKVDEFFSELKKSNVSENKLLKIYSPIFDNKEKIHELLVENYKKRAIMEPKFYAKTYAKMQDDEKHLQEAQMKQQRKPERSTETSPARKGSKAAVVALLVVALGASGVSIWKTMESGKLKKQNTALEEQVAEQNDTISDYQTQITTLNEQLSTKPTTITQTLPVVYMREVLTGNETITDEVASYLSSIKGLNYGSLGFAGRINLIADYCKTIYDVMGIPREEASKITRQLPTNYQFYMPSAKVETENGKWRLKGTYVRKADNKLINFEFKQENYMNP